MVFTSQRRESPLFLITNMADVTSRANQQFGVLANERGDYVPKTVLQCTSTHATPTQSLALPQSGGFMKCWRLRTWPIRATLKKQKLSKLLQSQGYYFHCSELR